MSEKKLRVIVQISARRTISYAHMDGKVLCLIDYAIAYTKETY